MDKQIDHQIAQKVAGDLIPFSFVRYLIKTKSQIIIAYVPYLKIVENRNSDKGAQCAPMANRVKEHNPIQAAPFFFSACRALTGPMMIPHDFGFLRSIWVRKEAENSKL